MYIAESEIKRLDTFCFSWPAHWMKSFMRIRKQVGEKRDTAGTHRIADCLLKNTSIKDGKYVVNHKI
jgi:hypothetical protein